jgi:hypothetical protein
VNAPGGAVPDGPDDADDAALLADLARLYDAVDPPPPGLAERVAFALELEVGDIGHELALLEQRTHGVGAARSAAPARTMTFTSENVTVMITVTAVDAARSRIDGWATPGAGAAVELRTPTGPLRTGADATGRFVLAGVPPGPVQLVLDLPPQADGSAGRRVVTPAVDL